MVEVRNVAHVRLAARDAGESVAHAFSTREWAERWAQERIEADDATTLDFEPASAEGQLRDALHFILGVGLRDSPSTYLHNDADIRAYRQHFGP
jgi:hypothetical protein